MEVQRKKEPLSIMRKQCRDDYELSVYAKCAYYTIILHMNNDTGNAFPGIKDLAKEMHVSLTTAVNALKELQEKGKIKKIARHGGRKRDGYYIISDGELLEEKLEEEPAPPKLNGQVKKSKWRIALEKNIPSGGERRK